MQNISPREGRLKIKIRLLIAALFPTLDLAPRNFSSINERLDTCMRQGSAVSAHTVAQGLALKPILAAILMIRLFAMPLLRFGDWVGLNDS